MVEEEIRDLLNKYDFPGNDIPFIKGSATKALAGEVSEIGVASIETLMEGEAGDNVGLLLRGVKKEDIERGMVLSAVNTITPHKKFKCQTYILSKDEGGRHSPFFTGYRPQFYFRTQDVTGIVTEIIE